MKVIVKYTFLFLLFFGITISVSAQSVLWTTYIESADRAMRRGDFVEAEKWFKSALKEAENLKNSELIARSNSLLGSAYFQQDKYADAEKLFLKSVETWEQANNKDSDEITYPLIQLGLVYTEQKKYDEAEEVFRRVITIREKIKSPDIASALFFLGRLYYTQKKLTEAEIFYRKALELYVMSFRSKEDFDLDGFVFTINNLIVVYEETKNYERLEPSYQLIIDLVGKNYGMNNPNLISYLEKYVALLRTQKRNAEAVKLEARAKRIKALNK